jgi:hypothetical protein
MNTALKTQTTTPAILLTTLNSKYIHAAFGLRYLMANLGELQSQAHMLEFTIHDRPIDIVEKIIESGASIVGFSVYIWNVTETNEVVQLLKAAQPDITVVLGGPEVSHVPDQPLVVSWADYVIKGPGERSFQQLCHKLLSDQPPKQTVIQGENVPLEQLIMPYDWYSEEDLRNRIIYVEASRGCPFKCQFCLSALDKTAKAFTLERFLAEMDRLYQQGARNFKFIDRTFNLKIADAVKIMEFFLERMDDHLTVHFEVIPDRLPDKLKDVILKFPAHSLQFEVGVQTFDPGVQDLIQRRQDNNRSKDNIRWICEHSRAHMHADLIFGLPGDTLTGFGESFNQLYALNPQEIQVGILKRLRGAPINTLTREYKMVYSPLPPYTVLHTRDISFEELQRVGRFARYWDIFANAGRFQNTLPLLLKDDAFRSFMAFSDTLFQVEQSTWKISQRRQFVLMYRLLRDYFEVKEAPLMAALQADFDQTGEKGRLDVLLKQNKQDKSFVANKRQQQHG